MAVTSDAAPVQADHKEIWLAPNCADRHDREWCEDNQWPEGCEECGAMPIKYVRADAGPDAVELAESWAKEFCEACPELPPGAVAVVTQLLASFSAAALRSSREERDEATRWRDIYRSNCLRQAIKIAELREQRDAARGYLIRNVLQPLHPNIKPLPDLIGVCTQVDNVTAGLREERDAAAVAARNSGEAKPP